MPEPPVDPMLRRLRLIQRAVFYAMLAGATLLFLAARSGHLTAQLHETPTSGNDSAAAPLPDQAPTDTTRPSTPLPAAGGPTSAGDHDSPIHAGFPTFTPAPTQPGAIPTTLPPLPANRIGILAGHWKYDTGATCPDGRREVDVTVDVAQRVRAILETRGLEVDVLPEHDPNEPQAPLQDYRAAALVSIHADVCNLPGYSGFKVARWRYSNIASTDDRLVSCLNQHYADWTQLARHENTISINMWNYYAFREIGLDTPAAIIELGFMLDDEDVLENKRYEVAMGVADGVSCFLKGGG